MNRDVHRATRAIALVALVGLVASTTLVGCARSDRPIEARRAVPPIDLQVPQHLETATFAMG